jgi:hypothetical protein
MKVTFLLKKDGAFARMSLISQCQGNKASIKPKKGGIALGLLGTTPFSRGLICLVLFTGQPPTHRQLWRRPWKFRLK